MQSFAEQLNAVRKQRNITQEQLAERMNVSRTTISRWESGKIMPDLDTIRLLSQLLDYNFFSYEDTPAEEPAEAPAPESEELPAPKPKKHRIWLLIAIVVCIAVACAALIPRFLSKPEANVNAFSLSTVAYLETDEEIGDCWRVTFAFQNESDVPFTPDHVVVLFYENDRIDDKIQMSYDEIRPWMDGDTLRKDDSPLHLLFTTNHLYYTRMECVMYGADANGHELQFRTSVKLSQEYATKPVKAEDQFGTLAEYIRAHESAKPEPGKAFLNVYTAVNPVKPVISEEFENRPMWIYDIQVAETNGVDFTGDGRSANLFRRRVAHRPLRLHARTPGLAERHDRRVQNCVVDVWTARSDHGRGGRFGVRQGRERQFHDLLRLCAVFGRINPFAAGNRSFPPFFQPHFLKTGLFLCPKRRCAQSARECARSALDFLPFGNYNQTIDRRQKGGSMLYLGWIVAAFLGGFLLATTLRKRTRSLRENFARFDAYQGRSYREVLSIAGAKPVTVICLPDGTAQKIWREGDYNITLAFDARDVCLGVIDEHI